MSQYRQTQTRTALNPNLVALIFVINFVVIGGLVFSSMPLTGSDSDDGGNVKVAQIDPTSTSTPTLLPTQTLIPSATPTELPTATSTAQVVAEVNSANTGYDPAVVEQGQQLFTLCSACHGSDARGLPNLGKDLIASEFVAGLTDEALLEFVKTGRPIWDPLNTTGIDMPGKGGNPALTDEQIFTIIAYIRSLSESGR